MDVIRYIIEGIQDTPFNKAVLYGCTIFNAYKKKLEMYQQMRSVAKMAKMGWSSPMCPNKEKNAAVSLARMSGESVAVNKILKINGQEMNALVDTGSDINIIST